MSYILLILQSLLIPALSPLVVGIIRKIKARFQNREGASVFQPYRDLWKLFNKEEVVSENASWVFRYTPYILFAISVVISFGIPTISAGAPFAYFGDFLVFVYLIALGAFFISLAGLDTSSAFGGMGASREMTIAALTEGGFIFSLFSISFITGRSDFSSMIAVLSALPVSDIIAPVLIAFIAFYIVLLAESARFPFDNPATHLELTMIHEAMILEYSGRRLALMEWAAANKLLIFITLAANVFFPWGVDISGEAASLFVASIAYILKILGLSASIAILESSIAKLRFFRLPDLLMTSLMLGVISIVITII